MSSKPIIGISLDHEPLNGSYACTPHYALRENYCNAVADNGGIPICLPHEQELVKNYVKLIDGLILTGGGYDIPPAYYGSMRQHATIKSNPRRTNFEMLLSKEMFKTGKPILAICGGQELLAVMLGGTLIQHIPDEIEDAIEHRQKPPFNKTCHKITIKEDSLLHKIIGKTIIDVNSDHHQAIKDVPEDITVNAMAPDGVIEGIEYSSHPFCLGVLWHPEHYATEYDKLIFKAFIDAC